MKSHNDSTSAPAASPNGQNRRRSIRYRSSESLVIRCEGGSSFTGVSVEINEGGMSAMANGILKVDDAVELEPVAGGKISACVRHKLGQLYGFEFVKITTEQARRIEADYKKSYASRAALRNA
jgi:hypothetical protein